jgi:hypothetical protein
VKHHLDEESYQIGLKQGKEDMKPIKLGKKYEQKHPVIMTPFSLEKPILYSKVKYHKDKWKTVTTKWLRWDSYVYTEKVNRWWLLKWLIRGKLKLRWEVPANQKDKKLWLEGVKQ